MRHRRAVPLLAGALVLALATLVFAFRSSPQAVALTNCDAPADVNTAAEQQLLDLMNQARAQNGAGPLKISTNLQRAALWKSADSSAYGNPPQFSHTDSLGRDTVSQPPNNRAIDCGYPTWAAEDIGWGFGTAQAMFDAFMNSPGHRANILDPTSVVAGVALIYQSGTPCWTVDFGQVDDTGSGGTSTATPTSTANSSPTVTQTATASPTETATPSPTPTRTSTPTHSVPLNAGINLVTFQGPSQSVESATGSLGSDLIAVYSWDAATQTWQVYITGGPAYVQRLHSLEAGTAYYFIMRTGGAWQY